MKRSRASQGFGEKRGSALVMSIFLMTGLMVMSYAFFRAASSAEQRLNGNFDDRRAFLLAEAALEESYESIRGGGTGDVGTMNDPAYLGGGVFWVVAEDLGGNTTRLTATAMIGSGRDALQSVVRFDPEEAPLFQATLNSKEQLTMNADVMVDSFDSSVGDYASQAINATNGYTHANMNGDVRSNQGIILNARATIFGDALPGPGYSVSFATDSYVSGSTIALSEEFVFPPIDFPVYPTSGAYSVANGSTDTLAAGDYDFSSLTIDKDATLTIEGPATLVMDDFVGGKDANLEIDATNGPVAIYVRNTYTHTAGFESAPVAGSPMALAFFVDAAQDIVFPSSVMIRGAYYLPNANIVFSSDNECWGAFAANRIDMSNNMNFHFDEHLLEHFKESEDEGDGTFEILAWSDAAVEPNTLLADRRDPIQVLQLDRSLLLSPANAWVTGSETGGETQY